MIIYKYLSVDRCFSFSEIWYMMKNTKEGEVMASISPDMYRGKLKEGEDFLNEADAFINTNFAILRKKDIDKKVEDAKILQGKMEILKDGLIKERGKDKNYEEMINSLVQKAEELKCFWNNFGTNKGL